MLGVKCALTLEIKKTPRKTWKAPFVIQGHKGVIKHRTDHGIFVSKQYHREIVLSIPATLKFKLCSTDGTQA